MTPAITPGLPPLREALYKLSMAERALDADLLDDVVKEYPAYAQELTDFAIQLALDELHDVADAAVADIDPTVISPAVSRAMSHFHNKLHGLRAADALKPARSTQTAINPFATMSRDEFRGFTNRMNVNTVFATKLRDRGIDPDTMTDGFRRHVADDLKAPLDVIVAHFAGQRTATPGQHFKADGKPGQAAQQSFEEAVRNSGLTEEQQKLLLSL